EETINKVGAAPDYILDNKELLDAYVIEAFEQSAAVNFPPVLSPGIYRKRPDLGIGRKFNGVWAMMPAGAKKRFKKFSRKIPVKLSPSRLASIRTFKGVGMDEYLEEVYQLDPGEDTEAFLHLYEAIEGTQLYDIAEIEHLPGKGTTSEGLMPLHPFTREAATMFLGEADMGNDASDMYPVQPGQRYYYLEIAGKRPMMRSAANGQLKSHRPGCAWLVLDFPKNQIQLFNFISESRAQEIAVKLRKKGNEGNLSIRFKKTIERHLEKLFSGKSGNIKIIHEAIRPGAWSDALKRIPQFLIQSFQEKLLEWTVKAFAGYLKNQAEEFCKATEDNADGVTVSISIINPPGLTQLRQVIKGKLNHGASIFLQGVLPEIKIKVEAGYSHE
ncbi:MAG: hypothetical protein GX587_12985, partial [Bacteroidales bacterium]|nr:hypothetical protein [Bacteroidales bacterium]